MVKKFSYCKQLSTAAWQRFAFCIFYAENWLYTNLELVITKTYYYDNNFYETVFAIVDMV